MQNIFHQSCLAMHTRFEVVWWNVDSSISSALFEAIAGLLNWVELKLSCHDPQSELYRLNRLAGEQAVPVSDYLFGVLKRVNAYHQQTYGYFDPDYRNSYPGKAPGALMQFDEPSRSIRFYHPKTKLDLGAIGKGFALEKIHDDILANNIDHAFISFGESSIMTRGRHPNGDYWPVGLSDMFQPGKNLCSMQSTNHSISVSATRSKNADEHAGKYHVYHPHDSKWVDQDRMIMVKTASPVDAEVLSTALLVADTEMQQKIVNNFQVEEAVQIIYQDQSPKIVRLI